MGQELPRIQTFTSLPLRFSEKKNVKKCKLFAFLAAMDFCSYLCITVNRKYNHKKTYNYVSRSFGD